MFRILWRHAQYAVARRARQTRSYHRPVPLVEGNQASDTRRIVASDIQLFGYLCGDRNPIHYEGLPSADGKTKHVVVHGAFLNALVSGVIGTKLPGAGSVVISQELRFPRPCLVGEEVTTTVQVDVVRKIVEVTFQCVVGVTSNNPKVVLEGKARLIVPASVKGKLGDPEESNDSDSKP